jgi:hypothetical protein
MTDQEYTDADLAQEILDEDIEYNGKIPYSCPGCGEEYELDEEAIFEYVLRSEYGLTPDKLEEIQDTREQILASLGEDQTIDDLLEDS